MSRRVELLILAVLAVACGLACWHLIDSAVYPRVAMGSGPGGVEVTPFGWILTALTAIGAWKAGNKSVFLLVQELVKLIPAGNWFSKAVPVAVSAGQRYLYAEAYKNAKSDEERAAIRQAAKLWNDADFDDQFPVAVAAEGGAA